MLPAGERYFADGLRELPDNRRLAILAVCAVEWEMFLVDAVAAVREALWAFAELGRALIGARDTDEARALLAPRVAAPGALGALMAARRPASVDAEGALLFMALGRGGREVSAVCRADCRRRERRATWGGSAEAPPGCQW